MKPQILLVALTSFCATILAQGPAKTRFSQLASPMGQPDYDTVQHIVTPAFQNAIHHEDAAANTNPAYNIKKSGFPPIGRHIGLLRRNRRALFFWHNLFIARIKCPF